MGTSRCSTVATPTSGGGCGIAADVFVVQAAVVNNAMVNTAVAQIAMRVSILFLLRGAIAIYKITDELTCPDERIQLSLLERPLLFALEVFEKVFGVHAPRHELGALV